MSSRASNSRSVRYNIAFEGARMSLVYSQGRLAGSSATSGNVCGLRRVCAWQDCTCKACFSFVQVITMNYASSRSTRNTRNGQHTGWTVRWVYYKSQVAYGITREPGLSNTCSCKLTPKALLSVPRDLINTRASLKCRATTKHCLARCDQGLLQPGPICTVVGEMRSALRSYAKIRHVRTHFA